MTVHRVHTWSLDDATLAPTLAIVAAGLGLPRRVAHTPASYPNSVLEHSPQGYWRLGDTAPNIALDSSGYGNTAAPGSFVVRSVSPDIAISDGNLAMGLVYYTGGFNGAITIPYTNRYFPSSGSGWSLEWWMGSALNLSAGNGCMFSFGNPAGASARGLQVIISATTLTVTFYQDSAPGGSGVISMTVPWVAPSAWIHYVITYDGATGAAASRIKIYRNGQLLTPSASSGTFGTGSFTAPSGNFYIGRRYDNNFPLGGNVDEVAIYSTVLDAATVHDHYMGGLQDGVARWTSPQFAAPATLRGVLLPGNLANVKSPAFDARATRAYVSLDGGVTPVEVDISSSDLNIAIAPGQSVTLDVDLNVVARAVDSFSVVAAPYVGSVLGGGPAIVYEEADPPAPPVDILSIDSTAAGIELTLSQSLTSWPVATYSAFPATKVVDVTSPAANKLLLVTEPWKPNVVSITSLAGQLQVVLDQPLGTGTIITNDPPPAIQVTGRSIIGSMLQITYSGAVVEDSPMPTIGDLITMPQPTIESTNVTGIFQGAIIIRSAILKALRELRETPTLIRDALASLPQDDLTKGRYGEKTLDECVRWFTQVKVPVKLGVSLTQLTSPCISVELNSGEEAEATLGDVDYNVIERDPWDATKARRLASVHAREQYNIIMMVQGEPEYLLFLDTLVRFGILRHKEDLLDERGFARLTWGVGPAGAMPDVPGRENFFARTLRLNGYVRHVWPEPLAEDQPAGFIESADFGPKLAKTVHNDDGTATSSPETPTTSDPFSPEDWRDRDILSGEKT